MPIRLRQGQRPSATRQRARVITTGRLCSAAEASALALVRRTRRALPHVQVYP
jgi:hypothetical protein